MKKANKSIVLVIPLMLLLTSCFLKPLDFDEQKWVETVENTDQTALYANNFDNGRFFNPWLQHEDRSFASFLRWRFSTTPEYSLESRKNKPELVPGLMDRIDSLETESDFIVWIGHATFLMRLNGEYWLTDPILTDRALLPKRVTPPAIRIDDLSRLEGKLNVVISHNHYDHLDRPTLIGLPEKSTIYVPAGLGEYVASLVAGEVIEMNWWEELTISTTTKLTCLPAQHWSLRLFQGYNSTLWASFMISTPATTVYFGGDSGYFKGYREIGEKFTDIDYALLPITAYDPRWFMHYPHMNTREAIRAFTDLGADYFIPTQWGTFRLGDNPPGLPPLDLRRDLEEMGRSAETYLILDIGEILLLKNKH
ncbi:MAG: MBL fold metallo-hydrolase [Desulfocapsaceae bacterium]|nr:MBL fold metallo-hydrolase [Desulfocapsaceae bacterium]